MELKIASQKGSESGGVMPKEYSVVLNCRKTIVVKAEDEDEAMEIALDEAAEVAELDWECDSVSEKE
ncbi:hypothetical protein [Enterococcus sp. LJL51]|uniref:hypothetical protein n=1 Tax=Enterococcus sp. LJL51 TaxID=3416656 RepID=UPI003CEAD224